MRIIAFSILTPFYFLKAGSLVEVHAVAAASGLIVIFLAIKMATKFIGILPLTVYHEFDTREGMYTTLRVDSPLWSGPESRWRRSHR
jgi:Kef-type K+ transport system membrane component KefB